MEEEKELKDFLWMSFQKRLRGLFWIFEILGIVKKMKVVDDDQFL
jgi:hypothetical protein